MSLADPSSEAVFDGWTNSWFEVQAPVHGFDLGEVKSLWIPLLCTIQPELTRDVENLTGARA